MKADTVKSSVKSRYTKLSKIGKGAFSTCFVVRDTESGRLCVMKKVKINTQQKTVAQRTSMKMELQIQKMMNHKHVVQYYDHYMTDDTMYLFLELCNFRTLKDYVRKKFRLSESEALMIIEQVVQAVDYMYKKSIVHRDLKLENVFLNSAHYELCFNNDNVPTLCKKGDYQSAFAPNDDMDSCTTPTVGSSCTYKPEHSMNLVAKVGDFGLSYIERDVSQYWLTLHCGTKYYQAPEFFTSSRCSHKSDVWAIGCMLYHMLYGFSPFSSSKMSNNVEENIKHATPIYKCKGINISEDTLNLLQSMLNKDPSKRPTCKAILQRLHARRCT